MAIDRPRLLGVKATPWEADGERFFLLTSQHELSDTVLRVPQSAAIILQHFDGVHRLCEIQAEVRAKTGTCLDDRSLEQLVSSLDDAYLLDTPRHHQRRREKDRAFRDATVREPSHAGRAYTADPQKLREQFDQMFDDVRAQHSNGAREYRGRLRGILSPHIDFRRGGSSFAHGFAELAERSTATVFVIIATSHYSFDRFIMTRKDFKTPLGTVRTHQGYVDRLVRHFGEEGFNDEIAHKPEHSIEFEVLFLQYLFDGRRDYRIVPLLVGSFSDSVESGDDPMTQPDVQRMAAALQKAEQECGEEVCYVISGDLAHVGMKFGDPWPIDEERSDWCRDADAQLLQSRETGRSSDLFQAIWAENDQRRICGYPPTFMMLAATQPLGGRVLCYDQYCDQNEIVSFASVAFDG